MSASYAKVGSLAEGLKREIEKITPKIPEKVIVLGSGLSRSFDDSRNFTVVGEVETDRLIQMHQLPNFTANDHLLKILVVKEKSSKKTAVVICGRKHLYELKVDEHMDKVIRLTRSLVVIGVKTFIFTSAVGGIKPSKPGSLILVTDHDGGQDIPLGLFSGDYSEGVEEFGPQFIDCTTLYKTNIGDSIIRKFDVTRGVLQWHLGPQFETPAQIKRLRMMDISAVGMSMLPEAMAVQQMKLHSSGKYSDIENIGIGVVANPAAGIGGMISHDGVKLTMEKASKKLIKFLADVVKYN